MASYKKKRKTDEVTALIGLIASFAKQFNFKFYNTTHKL